MPDLKPESARILVVEDDEDNRVVIERLLRLAGVAPKDFASIPGDPAAYLRQTGGSFDLMFLDLQLPKKDGYAVFREMRAEAVWADLKIVALTANSSRREMEACRTAGFDGFIGKPIDGRRFSELLGRILGGEAVWSGE